MNLRKQIFHSFSSLVEVLLLPVLSIHQFKIAMENPLCHIMFLNSFDIHHLEHVHTSLACDQIYKKYESLSIHLCNFMVWYVVVVV